MDYGELTKFTWGIIAVCSFGVIIQLIFGWTIFSVVSGVLGVPAALSLLWWIYETIKRETIKRRKKTPVKSEWRDFEE